MCLAECKGDFYRGCGCYKRLFYTGNVTDCNQPNCTKSAAHMHKTARGCYCIKLYNDKRLVQNYIQTKCDDCAEMAKRGRRYQ